MGELIRSKDWSTSAVGAPGHWPQPLRTAISILLNSPFPMFVWWGSELTTFYNDAYRLIAGEKHPGALGEPGSRVWAEIWEVIGPMAGRVLQQGISTWAEDQLLYINRRGYVEESYFTFSYSPVFEESGGVGGVFCACTETTEKVLAARRIAESERNLRNTIIQSPVAMCILKGPQYVVEIANERMYELWGKGEAELLGRPIFEGLPQTRRQGLEELLQAVYHQGERFSAQERPVVLPRGAGVETLYVNFVYEPFREGDGTVSGVLAVAIDVSEQVRARKKIEESEQELQRFKYMADHAQDPFILVREDGTFAYLNKKALDAWGYTEEEAKGLRVPDVDPMFDEATFSEIFARAHQEPLPQFETLYKRKDGHIYTVEVNMGGLTLGGKPHLFAVARDITERKRTEEALRQSNERFQLINRATQDAIWDWELTTDRLWWNEGFKEMFGYRDEEIEPGVESWYNRLHPDDVERVMNSIHRAINQGGRQWSSEYRFRRADGTYAIVFDRGYALHDQDGRPTRMLGSMQDITARKTFENTLAESEERFRTLANSISHLAWIAESDGRVYWYNQRWYEYTGTRFEEMQGWGWEKVHHPDHVGQVVTSIREAMTKGEPWELTFPLRNGDGAYRWFLTRAYPVKNKEGKIIHWIGTHTDIDEQKQSEVILEEKVRDRTEELERKNKELEQFAYAASHDMQEPLRKIATFSNFLLDRKMAQLDEQGKSYLNKIDASVRRMKTIIDDLLRYSHQTRADHQWELTSLDELVDAVKFDLDLVIHQKGATIKKGKLPRIRAISSQVYQLFYNLISNALKFTRPDLAPQVSISGREQSDAALLQGKGLDPRRRYVQLTVSDNGIGFAQEHARQIFHLFKRLHGRSEYEGTGIGLALCKKIVDNHGGCIWAESEPGQGATFQVLLPVEGPVG